MVERLFPGPDVTEAEWRACSDPYDDRDFDRMPALGDAPEEAGCTNLAISAHCRGPVDHVRGCWAVDLLLGKW